MNTNSAFTNLLGTNKNGGVSTLAK